MIHGHLGYTRISTTLTDTTPETYPWRYGKDYNYAPWWWFWTPRTLTAMVESAGFRVTEIFDGWVGYSHYLVCEPA